MAGTWLTDTASGAAPADRARQAHGNREGISDGGTQCTKSTGQKCRSHRLGEGCEGEGIHHRRMRVARRVAHRFGKVARADSGDSYQHGAKRRRSNHQVRRQEPAAEPARKAHCSSSRKPTPRTVSIKRGCAGSSASLRRRLPKWTSRRWSS